MILIGRPTSRTTSIHASIRYVSGWVDGWTYVYSPSHIRAETFLPLCPAVAAGIDEALRCSACGLLLLAPLFFSTARLCCCSFAFAFAAAASAALPGKEKGGAFPRYLISSTIALVDLGGVVPSEWQSLLCAERARRDDVLRAYTKGILTHGRYVRGCAGKSSSAACTIERSNHTAHGTLANCTYLPSRPVHVLVSTSYAGTTSYLTFFCGRRAPKTRRTCVVLVARWETTNSHIPHFQHLNFCRSRRMHFCSPDTRDTPHCRSIPYTLLL